MKKQFLSILLIALVMNPLQATNVELGDPNLSSDSETPSTLAVSLKNPAVEIVGLQFDIVYSNGLASPGIPTLPQGSKHEMDVRLVEPGRYRVMVFSPTNLPLVAPYSIDLRFAFAEEAPDGGPAMDLENLILAASDGSEIEYPLITYGPIGKWREDNFSDDVWNSKTTGGDSGDADNDGLKNIQEFYFKTDPKSLGSNVTSVVQGALASDGSGGKVLRLTWTGRKAVDGVKAVVYGGTDPAKLTEVVSVKDDDGSDDGSDDEVIKLKAEFNLKDLEEDEKAYFMEIRVERE